ncbi:hypothetical protein E0504_49320 [Parafrankia sp. BMG5.11]|nr:hypothetical protein E0504_49320 [Parafrankia sp. BMG5.11]
MVDKGRFAPTEEGTPQGGVISPLLLNIALQGMEEAAGVEYDYRGMVKAGRPTVITYADDFVALCHSREQAQAVQAKVDTWLAERGLTLNKEKTAIRHVDDGFDFLSFTIRRYHPKGGGTKVLTRPSKEALARIRRGNAESLRSLRGANVAAVIQVMNPKIQGQANYFRNGASKEAYQSLDEHLWQLIYKWIRHRHPHRSWKWVVNRYFGPFNSDRNDRWILSDRTSGAYLHKYAWTPIVRHAPVPGRNSPDDPDLARYWSDRRRRRKPPQLAKSRLSAMRAQDGTCPLCGLPLLLDGDPPDSPSQWEHWYAAVGKVMTYTDITDSENRTKYRLVHTGCARRQGDGTRPARTSRAGTRAPLRRA